MMFFLPEFVHAGVDALYDAVQESGCAVLQQFNKAENVSSEGAVTVYGTDD
jgi:hypothetical protein